MEANQKGQYHTRCRSKGPTCRKPLSSPSRSAAKSAGSSQSLEVAVAVVGKVVRIKSLKFILIGMTLHQYLNSRFFTFEKNTSVWEVIFKEKITSPRPELAARLTALTTWLSSSLLPQPSHTPPPFTLCMKCSCLVSVFTCLLRRIQSPLSSLLPPACSPPA